MKPFAIVFTVSYVQLHVESILLLYSGNLRWCVTLLTDFGSAALLRHRKLIVKTSVKIEFSTSGDEKFLEAEGRITVSSSATKTHGKSWPSKWVFNVLCGTYLNGNGWTSYHEIWRERVVCESLYMQWVASFCIDIKGWLPLHAKRGVKLFFAEYIDVGYLLLILDET